MEHFIPFVSLCVEHNYYTPPVNRHFSLTPTAETEVLMRRRGLLFIETPQRWAWLLRRDSAGFGADDVLELSVHILDTDFFRVTRLENYHPQTFYQLKLGNARSVDAASALRATDKKKWGGEFCRIRMKPTSVQLEKARKDMPVNYTLRFYAQAFTWEYLFVLRDNNTEKLGNLLLEETKNRITFEKAGRLENSSFGTNVWRTVSTTPVSALECSDYKLVLSTVIQEYPLKKRTVSRFIECPQPGKYISDDPDLIRKVCYI